MNSKIRHLVIQAMVVVLTVSTLGINTTKASDVPSPVTINFQVEGASSTIYKQSLEVSACATPNNSELTVNAFCAFTSAGLTVDATWFSYGAMVNSINGEAGDAGNYWLWFLNGDSAQVGIDSYILKPGDTVLWSLGRQPLKVAFSTLTPTVNATTTIYVLGFNANNYGFEPVAGAEIVGTNLVTNANGTADILATSTTPFTVSVIASGYISSEQFTLSPVPEHINLILRGSSTTAFSGSVNLTELNTPDILVTPTNSTNNVAVSPRSLLGILLDLQTTSNSFKITDLAYYSSFNSFLLNCVAIPATSTTPDCYNWTYAINSSYPQTGMEQQMLKNGDTVYVFFGSPHRVSLSTNSVVAGSSFTATAEKYNLPLGNYEPLTGVTLGAGTQNSDFTFTELATSTVGSNGQAVFTINTTGTFSVGIQEDYYFPAQTITITEATNGGGGGGGGGGITHTNLDSAKALAFISASQNADGSFSSPFSTDWTALAYASAGSSSAKTKLKNYLLTATPKIYNITDYERHAMALQALGINPYNGTPVDYITPIVNAFDGTQIGDKDLDTDDIFAIFPLVKAGYTANDTIIQKTLEYIISTQKADGSWDSNVDMTSSAMQAIGPFSTTPGYSKAMKMAMEYITKKQNSNGGFENIDSTSWAQTMLNSVKEGDPSHFVPLTSSLGYFPTDYIGSSQQADGGVLSGDRVWSTAYAVVAVSGKGWFSLLTSFPKPAATSDSTGGAVLGTCTTTVVNLATPKATSTPETTTSTLPTINQVVATTTTSTVPVVVKITQLKIKKVISKTPSPKAVTQVLGETTVVVPTPPPVKEESVPKSGYFGKFWKSVKTFFTSLF